MEYAIQILARHLKDLNDKKNDLSINDNYDVELINDLKLEMDSLKKAIRILREKND